MLRLFPAFASQLFYMLPDFVIIGAQKCGTSSLYNYLVQHPSVISSLTKEIHYFDISFSKGLAWYKQHFPTIIEKQYSRVRLRRSILTGEASPYYIFHPHAAKRMRAVLPNAKLIILLRNPIDRAYSHYQHSKRTGFESLPFGEAVDQEDHRLAGELERMISDENYYSPNHQAYTYLSRGIYVDQIKMWYEVYAPEQVLVLCSEEFFTETARVFRQVLNFLGLPDWPLRDFRRHNQGGHYPEMEAAVRRRLSAYFAPHNQRLYDFLGMDFNWDVDLAGGHERR